MAVRPPDAFPDRAHNRRIPAWLATSFRAAFSVAAAWIRRSQPAFRPASTWRAAFRSCGESAPTRSYLSNLGPLHLDPSDLA